MTPVMREDPRFIRQVLLDSPPKEALLELSLSPVDLEPCFAPCWGVSPERRPNEALS